MTKLEKSWLCIACFPDTAQPKEGFPLAAKVISVPCEATGSAWGGQRPVWGADWPGEDREEDHAASADAAAVWTLLRAAPGGHRLAGQGPMALWRVFIILKSPALWLQTLEVTDVFLFFHRLWSSQRPSSSCLRCATWTTTSGEWNTAKDKQGTLKVRCVKFSLIYYSYIGKSWTYCT